MFCIGLKGESFRQANGYPVSLQGDLEFGVEMADSTIHASGVACEAKSPTVNKICIIMNVNCQLSARLQIYITTLIEVWANAEGMRRKLIAIRQRLLLAYLAAVLC